MAARDRQTNMTAAYVPPRTMPSRPNRYDPWVTSGQGSYCIATIPSATKFDLAPYNQARHPVAVHPSLSVLSEPTRVTMCGALNLLLLDGIDLQCMAKVAHWNARGPLFLPLHKLYGKLADALSEHNDNLAERVATLGGDAVGTVRQAAAGSRLQEYPGGLDPLLERIGVYLALAHDTRRGIDDLDTQDLLTQLVREIEKIGWMLSKTVEA